MRVVGFFDMRQQRQDQIHCQAYIVRGGHRFHTMKCLIVPSKRINEVECSN